MNSQSFLALCLAALLCPTAFAENPGARPLSESDLLRQIDALAPNQTAAGRTGGAPGSFFDSPLAEGSRAGSNKKEKELKKSKGPTEITALEATFDQKANLAVFLGEVVVKDPEFNVICDKLTAYLKSDKKKGDGAAARPAGEAADEPPQKSGGLERAIAESSGDRRVIITQDKTEADGSITQSIGKADKATYDAVTGDIILTGSPDVIQGINRVQATEPGTVMVLNRDGRMKATGPHRTTIVDKAGAGL